MRYYWLMIQLVARALELGSLLLLFFILGSGVWAWWQDIYYVTDVQRSVIACVIAWSSNQIALRLYDVAAPRLAELEHVRLYSQTAEVPVLGDATAPTGEH